MLKKLIALGIVLLPINISWAQHCNPNWTAAYSCMEGCGGCSSTGSAAGSGDGTGGVLWKAIGKIFAGPSPTQVAQQQDAALRAINDQGIAAFRQKDYATAEADFKKYLEYDPNDPIVRRNLANAQNSEGLDAYNKGDYTTALNYFQQALANDPETDTDRHFITEDISAAQEKIAEAQIEQGQRQQDKITANNIQKSIQGLVKTLNTAPSSGGLDFDGGNSNTTPTAGNGDKGAGLGFMDSEDSGVHEVQQPDLNTMVVDARNVPTGLPPTVEAEIPNTPAGNRVRKGFQAIMDHDWAAARLWFQDALKQEPGDPGLKRLVDLAQFTLQKENQTTTANPIGKNAVAKPIGTDAGEINNALGDYNNQNANALTKSFILDEKDEDPAWVPFMRYITSKLPKKKIPVGPVSIDANGIRG
jgi:tetratricopeptide (TPR) repeat protein